MIGKFIYIGRYIRYNGIERMEAEERIENLMDVVKTAG